MGEHRLDGLAYGHFGDGCIHVRIDFPLAEQPAAVPRLPRDAAQLVAAHGGSLSGEHGDGRARSELLPYDVLARALSTPFAAFKHAFDPDNVLNPGRAGRPRRRSTPTCGCRRRPRSAATSPSPTRTTAATSPRPCTAASGSASAAPTPRRGGGFMCPSLPGDPGREGLDPRPGPGAAGDGERLAGRRRLRLRRRCTRPSTSACPARPARPTARPASTWRPTRPRCCTRPTGASVRPAAHYSLGWLPRWARVGVGRARRSPTRATRRAPGLRQAARRHRPAPGGARVRRPDVPALVRRPRGRPRRAPATR